FFAALSECQCKPGLHLRCTGTHTRKAISPTKALLILFKWDDQQSRIAFIHIPVITGISHPGYFPLPGIQINAQLTRYTAVNKLGNFTATSIKINTTITANISQSFNFISDSKPFHTQPPYSVN
ncbi:hypothetical protein EWI94_22885, partial [Salmonella enterica subsp. enterica serovar Kottbus]|nr:hypothetical protein [Salmonella enterica subsp. enterica serovar Kottbus]ECB3488803.1 hypothetical protein [Salmonella enterica subsp. enterica serovar Kottbus]